MNVNLTDQQRSEVIRLRDQKLYPEMYAYIGDVVSAAAAGTDDGAAKEDDLRLYTWLGTAKSINADDKSLLSEIVRGSMRSASLHSGILLSDEQLQASSDALAKSVGGLVLNGNFIPPAEVIIGQDVKQAIDGLKLESWQWAGTAGDILPRPFGLGKNYQSFPLDIDLPRTLAKAALQNIGGLRKYLRNRLPESVAQQDAIGQDIPDAMMGLLTLRADTDRSKDSLSLTMTLDALSKFEAAYEGADVEKVRQGFVTRSPTTKTKTVRWASHEYQ